MDWIMSNTKRFCEMVAVQKDFPFVLTPKVSDTGKNVESEKCSPGQAPILDKVCSCHRFVIVKLLSKGRSSGAGYYGRTLKAYNFISSYLV